MTVRNIKLLSVWGLLLGMVVRISAAEYEVDGQIEQTIYKQDGSIQSEDKSRFTVFVNGRSWLIQTTNFDKAGKPFTVNETASINTGVIYSVGVMVDKDSLPGGRNGAAAWNVANIYSNNAPVGETEGYRIGHLWLMFASGGYLKGLSTSLLTPVYDLNASAAVDPTLKRWAKWELINDSASLPLNVTYLVNGTNSPIDATYVATGVTNIGDLKIPSGFVFEQIDRYAHASVKPGDSIPTYPIYRRAVATVTAVRPYCSRAKFVPTAKDMTLTIDERLACVTNSNPRMYYHLRDGVRWVSIEEAKKLSVGPVPPSPPSRGIVLTILLLPSALFLSYWLLNRKRG